MNNGRPNYNGSSNEQQTQQPSQQPYGYPQQGWQGAYGTPTSPYEGYQQGTQGGYGYPQGQQPVPNGYGYPQGQQPAPNSYGYPQQGQQPVSNGYGYPQGQQPAPNGYGYPQGQTADYQRVGGYPYQANGVPQQSSVPQHRGPVQQTSAAPRKRPTPARSFDVDGATRLVVFLALPVLVVLFVVGMVLGNAVWLKWLFTVLAAVVLVTIWVRPVLRSDLKMTCSFVLAAMMVVAVVSALSAAPGDLSQPGSNGGSVQSSGTEGNGGEVLGSLVEVNTAEPTVLITNPPSVSSDLESDAVLRLESFLYFWQNNATEEMLALCLPSWVAEQDKPLNQLFSITASRKPLNWTVTAISGTDSDLARTVTATIEISKMNDSDPKNYQYKVIMQKENENWYVDPRSLASNEPEATATPASAYITQPPTPEPAEGPNQVLYYNPNGGSRYHIDPDCSSVAAAYKPMTSFTYGELDNEPYSELVACGECGAPLRED